jgi:hypothetical protein
MHLSSFLHKCCKRIEEAAIPLDKEYNLRGGELTSFLFDWDEITNNENIQRLYSFLKEKFGWNWLDKANFKTEDKGTMVISYSSNIILIKRNKEGNNDNKVILTFNGKKRYEFYIFHDRCVLTVSSSTKMINGKAVRDDRTQTDKYKYSGGHQMRYSICNFVKQSNISYSLC